jgi:hypothetical protein
MQVERFGDCLGRRWANLFRPLSSSSHFFSPVPPPTSVETLQITQTRPNVPSAAPTVNAISRHRLRIPTMKSTKSVTLQLRFQHSPRRLAPRTRLLHGEKLFLPDSIDLKRNDVKVNYQTQWKRPWTRPSSGTIRQAHHRDLGSPQRGSACHSSGDGV